jgi:hypothetical protein
MASTVLAGKIETIRIPAMLENRFFPLDLMFYSVS